MFLGVREQEKNDRFGRKFIHEIIQLRCDVCGKEWETRGSRTRITSRKHHTCSNECSKEARKTSGVIQRQIAMTNLERYGAENPFAAETCKEKIRQTSLERYGNEHARSSDVVKEKVKQTMLKRYGVENAAQSPEIMEKARQTMIQRHGVAYPMQMQSVKEALMSGSMQKFGTPFMLQSELGQELLRMSCRTKYGIDHYQSVPEVKERIRQTCLERYGVPNVSQSEYFANLPFKHGCHKTGYITCRGVNIWFRSSYEERFLRWCDTNDNIIDVKCNFPIEYEFEGKKRRYFIDFLVSFNDGRRVLYEVKSEYALMLPKNQAKFGAAREQLSVVDCSAFEVITENTLKTMGV